MRILNYVCERWELTPVCGKGAVQVGNKNKQQANEVPSVNIYRMKYIQGCEGNGLNANYLRVI